MYVARHNNDLLALFLCFDSDEDDALYEKVSCEQWRVQCLVQLLEEMKDSDLPGEFFLLLLQVLTSASLFQPDRFQCSSTMSIL